MITKCYAGIDCGGTKIAGALFDPEGNILFRDTVLLGGSGGDAAFARMRELTGSLFGQAAARRLVPVSLGVCIPGIAYHDSGRVWAPNIPDWENYPLLDRLKEAHGKDLPVAIDSDRACCILGETWLGAAKGCRNAVFVAVGTGIGAGLLIDGNILRGHGDIAGATGWMALEPPYDTKYDMCGNFEYYASGNGIVRAAEECLAEEKDRHSTLKSGKYTSYDVFLAYDQNDPAAICALDKVITLWGMAAANYVSLFNPEKIIFGGGVFGPAVRFIPRIRAEAEKWAQPISMKQVTFSASGLDTDAGLFGAGRLAMLNERKDKE